MTEVNHSSQIARFSGIRPSNQTTTDNQYIIYDVSDALLRIPPPLIDKVYMGRVQRAASFLGNPSDVEASKKATLMVTGASSFGGNRTTSSESKQSDIDVKNAAMSARNNVAAVVTRVDSFIAKAKNLGHFPPDNPFVVIGRLNHDRHDFEHVEVDEKQADSLVQNMKIYVGLLAADSSDGGLDLEKNTFTAAQLASVNLLFDGYGGSGNPAVDILKFVPDMDAIKEQKSLESLANLDFRKRVPKVMFTSDFSPDGRVMGSIIGWKKIADASGYIIRRKEIFSGKEISFTLTNTDAQTRYDSIVDYVRAWALTFYDTVDPSSIFAFLDSTIDPNSFYLYTIQSYQVHNQGKDAIFDVELRPMSLSKEIFGGQFIDQLTALSPIKDPNSVSPYPVLSQQLLNNSDYDWMLAGVNVRASIKRSDSRSLTRKYSYLAAQLDFVFEQMNSQLFFVPVDVNQIAKNVVNSINKFGVTQTLQEIMREVGIFYYFEGKDPIDTHFDKIGTTDVKVSGIISTVASAIDPENATLDIQVLTSNMTDLLGSAQLSKTSDLSSGQNQDIQAQPSEIDMSGGINNGVAPQEIQFLQHLGNAKGKIDLTTFEGIGKFVKIIRIFSDFGPNRGAPLVTNPDDVTRSILASAKDSSAATLNTLDVTTGRRSF